MYRVICITVLTSALLTAGCAHRRGVNPAGTLETTETDIAAAMSGRILEVRAQLGDRVKAGDTLVVLDTELIRLQREQSQTNRGSIEAQQLVAEDALEQAESTLALAETTLTRTHALYEQGSATSQQLDEVQTRRDVLSRQVSASRHQLDALAAEQAKLDALLAVYDRQLKDGVIVAPQDGTVILRNAEPGEFATPGSVLLRLADLEHLELRIFLIADDLARVKIGQELSVFPDALKGERMTGRVTWVSSEAEFTPKNAQTRQARAQLVYAVKLSVANDDGKLHIGMPAEVEIP